MHSSIDILFLNVRQIVKVAQYCRGKLNEGARFTNATSGPIHISLCTYLYLCLYTPGVQKVLLTDSLPGAASQRGFHTNTDYGRFAPADAMSDEHRWTDDLNRVVAGG